MGTLLAVGTKILHGIKRVLQWSHIGSQVKYRGEGYRHTVHFYNIISYHAHVGTPKQKQTGYTVFLDKEFHTTVVVVIIWYRENKLKMRFGVVISKEVFFYLVIMGWVLDISLLLYENSINQSMNNMHRHTHTHDRAGLRGCVQFNKYTHGSTHTHTQTLQIPQPFYLSCSVLSYCSKQNMRQALTCFCRMWPATAGSFFEISRLFLQFICSRCAFQVRCFVKIHQLFLSFLFDAHPLSLTSSPSAFNPISIVLSS